MSKEFLRKVTAQRFHVTSCSYQAGTVCLITGIFFLLLAFSLLNVQTVPAQESRCLICHSKFKKPAKTVHAALGMGCETCHQPPEGKSHPGSKGSMKLTQEVPGLCLGCHDQSKFKGKSVHSPVAGGMCTSCHNPHQSESVKLLVSDQPDLCFNCHDQSKFKGKSVHSPVAGGMCTSCHNPHQSGAVKLLVSDQPDLCFNCHDKKEFTKKNVHAAVMMGCTSCHSAHAGDNPKLLAKPTNVLCASCHAKEATGRHVMAIPGKGFHPIKGRPDPSDPSKEMSCASCHVPHSSDFEKLFPIGDVCGKCHKF